jgi:hypothetical protein
MLHFQSKLTVSPELAKHCDETEWFTNFEQIAGITAPSGVLF